MISGDYSFSIFTSIYFLSTILEEDPDRDDVCDAVQLEVADVGGGLHAPDEEAGLHLVQPRPGAGRHPAPVQQLRGVPQLRTSENIHNIVSRMQGKKKLFLSYVLIYLNFIVLPFSTSHILVVYCAMAMGTVEC